MRHNKISPVAHIYLLLTSNPLMRVILNVRCMVHPAFVCFACCFLSLSLLPLHYCFTHIYQQDGEVNAILQDIAKSRQNILQSLNGVSTVLKMSCRHTPWSGTNVSVSARKQGNNC